MRHVFIVSLAGFISLQPTVFEYYVSKWALKKPKIQWFNFIETHLLLYDIILVGSTNCAPVLWWDRFEKLHTTDNVL